MNDNMGASKIELKDLARIFFRRKGLFMMGFMAVTPLVFPIIFGLPNLYRSRTVLLIRDKANLKLIAGQMNVSTPIRERVRTFRSEILSWNSVTRAMDAVGLSSIASSPLEMESLVGQTKRGVSISRSGSTAKTDIVTVAFTHRDPVTTQRFLNILVTNFIEKSLKEQRVEIVSAINFIKEQIAVYEEKLQEANSALIAFKKKHAYDLPNQKRSSVNTILTLEMRKTDLTFRLEDMRKERALLEEKIKEVEENFDTTVAPSDPIISDLEDKLERMDKQVRNLELVYTEMHPDLIETQRLIEATKNKIEIRKTEIIDNDIVIENKELDSLNEKLSELDLKMASVETRKRRIESSLREAKDKLEEMPSLYEKYVHLQNEADAVKGVHNSLKQKLEATKMAQHIDSTEQGVKFEILEPARLPLKPYKPNRWQILIMGIAAGLAVGALIALIVEYADHSFRGTEDARARLPVPVIGVIPSIITAREKRRKHIKNFLFTCLSILYLIGLSFVSAYVYKYYH